MSKRLACVFVCIVIRASLDEGVLACARAHVFERASLDECLRAHVLHFCDKQPRLMRKRLACAHACDKQSRGLLACACL